MTKTSYDIVIIGAGSVGNPAALFLAQRGLKVLVLDQHAGPGQGQNKAAIGGVRATHSDPAKISLALNSLQHFTTFQDTYGYDIGWKKGGYCFPAYDDTIEQTLKSLLQTQHSYGLEIDYYDADFIRQIVPGINEENLRGGTYSPGDGQVSPLMYADACWKVAQREGAEYHFNETVKAISLDRDRVTGVVTDRGSYTTGMVINAAGAAARQIGLLTDLNIPVQPDSHEAGISVPVKPFLDPLVVDLRPGADGRTSNFYFGQNHEGQIIFCYTPRKLFVGENIQSSSEFLPIISRRLIDLIPALQNLMVRRVWRGLYPMTPDGVMIVDEVQSLSGMYLAVGMCGQGFMLGPGVAECLANLVIEGEPTIDRDIFSDLSFSRDFSAHTETLK